MLEEFVWSDEVDDPRPLRRLGVVSGSVLLAAVVLLLHEHRRGARGLSGVGLIVVWLVVAIAALLFLGAVSGLVARRASARHGRLDPQELHDRQVVQALLRRGDDVPPELRSVLQRVVDDIHSRRWSLIVWVVLCAIWVTTAFTYSGWERWLHLAVGSFYSAIALGRVIAQHRVLRRAARLDIRAGRSGRLARSGR